MRIRTLVLALATLTLTTAVGRAQVTLPVFDPQKDPAKGPVKGVVFEDASQSADFRHGSLLRVTLNDASETKVLGTLVRVDRKNTRIYVRTEPGAAPRAISQKEIKKVEKGVRDPIRPAAHKEAVVEPEIHQVVVYNGQTRTVRYHAGAALSSAERNRLRDLEDAENEFARLDQMHGQRNTVVDTELAIQAERLASHELINSLLAQQVQSGFWVELPSRSWHVLYLRHDQPELTKVVSLMPTMESWTKAREEVRAQRSHAVLEDGHIVAVVVEEK